MNSRNYILRLHLLGLLAGVGSSSLVRASEFSGTVDDPLFADAPIPGFVGTSPDGFAPEPIYDEFQENIIGYTNNGNYPNPLFFSWANEIVNYSPANPEDINVFPWDELPDFKIPENALGPVTADHFSSIVSLGELAANEMGVLDPGSISIKFARPLSNLPDADFAVFENGIYAVNAQSQIRKDRLFAELAYVEVSSNGTDFVRFPSRSINPPLANAYVSLDPGKVFNLAGKHANGGGQSWGTPFDLSTLPANPSLDLTNIAYVRIVDIPGNGFFKDSLGSPIYDPHVTFGSSGFDLEAIGAISVPVSFASWMDIHQIPVAHASPHADPDNDGMDNLLECAIGTHPLTPNPEACPALTWSEDHSPAFSFTRDTRCANLRVDVEFSSDLKNWQALARSDRGNPLTSLGSNPVAITDSSDSYIQSIGVIRRHTVAAPTPLSGNSPRFFRLNISTLP